MLFWKRKPIQPGQRIPCLFLAYGAPDIIKASLDSFVQSGASSLNIHILHNPGDSRAENAAIAKICRHALRDGSIASYARYAQNISNNAYLQYVLAERAALETSSHIMLTDGDVLLSPGTIEEELRILATHESVFACGARMDAARWSDKVPTKQELVQLHTPPANAKADYTSAATGIWAVLFRTSEFFAMIDRLVENDRRFTDGNLKAAARWALGKSWVATKATASRELNRESSTYVADRATAHVAFGRASPEPESSRYAMWNHNLFTTAKLHTPDGNSIQPAIQLKDTAPRYAADYSQSIEAAVAALPSPIATTYIRKETPPRDAPPGLHLCYGGKPVRMSWPRLWPSKAVAWFSLEPAFHAPQPVSDSIEIERSLTFDRTQAAGFINFARSYVRPGGTIVIWMPDLEPGLQAAQNGERRKFAKLGAFYAIENAADLAPDVFLEKLNAKADAFWSIGNVERWCAKNHATFTADKATGHPLAGYTRKVVIQL